MQSVLAINFFFKNWINTTTTSLYYWKSRHSANSDIISAPGCAPALLVRPWVRPWVFFINEMFFHYATTALTRR